MTKWFALAFITRLAHADPEAELAREDAIRLAPRTDLVSYTVETSTSSAIDTLESRLKLAAPLVISSHGVVMFAGAYDATRLRFGGDELVLHRMDAALIGATNLTPTLALSTSVIATHASDFRAYTSAAWEGTASLSASWRASRSDAVMLGAVYATRGVATLLPLIGWVHQAPDSPLRIDVLFPQGARADYAILCDTRIGVAMELAATNWAVQTPMSTVVANRTSGAFAVTLQQGLAKHLVIDARAGVLAEQLKLPVDDMIETRPTHASAFAQVGLLFRP